MFQADDRIEDRYRVFDVKQGGMGMVFLCEDLAWVKGGRPLKVALKTLLPQLCRKPGAADRFFHEARLWVEIGKHPNILHAQYVKKINDMPFICIEFISGFSGMGPDLESWIDSKNLTLEQSLHFAVQFCNGMIYAANCFAEKGLRFVHRDIKPGNTMIDGALRVKITDFGLAKIADDPAADRAAPEAKETISGRVNLTMDGAVLGTPRYMSPEQCRGATDIDLRSDVYSFGCMLFEMLTGRPPFEAAKLKEMLDKHKNEAPPSPSAFAGGLPLRLNALVLKCLSKDPAERYADFSALRQDLAEIYTKASGKPSPEAETGVKKPGQVGVGDKLNKSLSLYELGQTREGVRLFAEAIGEQGKEKKAPESPAARSAGVAPVGQSRLVKGGLVLPSKPAAPSATRGAGRGSPSRPLEAGQDKTVSPNRVPPDESVRQRFPTHVVDRDAKTIPAPRPGTDRSNKR